MARTIGDLVLDRGRSAFALSRVFGEELEAHSGAPYHCWALRAHPFAGGTCAGRISKPKLSDYVGVAGIPDDRKRGRSSPETTSVIVGYWTFSCVLWISASVTPSNIF